MGGTITVENVLTSTSVSNALSANQGRVLNGKIEALDTRVEELENNSSESNASNSITRIWSE